MRLAESLGAKEVTTLTADSAADAVIDYARKHKITKVIVGRPTRPRWREWLRGSFVDQILRRTKEIDVYVVSEGKLPKKKKRFPRHPSRVPWRSYLTSLLLVAGATGASEIASRIPLADQYDHVLSSGGGCGRSPPGVQAGFTHRSIGRIGL